MFDLCVGIKLLGGLRIEKLLDDCMLENAELMC